MPVAAQQNITAYPINAISVDALKSDSADLPIYMTVQVKGAAGNVKFTPAGGGTALTETTINRHQAKIVLLRHGMLATVEAIIASGSEEMQLAWQEAPQFRRTSPTLLAMASSLDLSEAQVDALFAEAAAVEV